jgi:hypothetical protein
VARQRVTAVGYVAGDGPLYFVVARGCTQGSQVTWTPRSAAHLVTAAYARDGRAAAVVLQPSKPFVAFRLDVVNNGGLVAAVTVK